VHHVSNHCDLFGLYPEGEGASVDAECAFSIGRNAMSWNQQRMSTGRFQAKIAVGQWYSQPFMPSISDLASALKPNPSTKDIDSEPVTKKRRIN